MAQTLLVQDLMTRSPHTIDVSKTLADVKRLMKRRAVRHLPVLDEGALVGLISERDVELIESHSDAGADEIPLAEAMSLTPWTVTPSTPVEVTARHMARHKLGSAVVVDNEKVVGIFTSNDALSALAQVLAAGRGPPPKRAARER